MVVPSYEPGPATLAFSVIVTTAESPDRITSLVGTPHGEAPATFEDATLFIDRVAADGDLLFVGGTGGTLDPTAGAGGDGGTGT